MFKKTLWLIIIVLISAFVYTIGINEYQAKEKTITVKKVQRKYRLHLPKNYDESKEYPLVINFHSYTSDPRLTELITGFSRKADAEGFIVVYPYGTKLKRFTPYSWNADFCCGIAQEKEVNDVAFVDTLISQLSNDYSINDNKVYAVGFSNGGMLVNKLGTELDSRFAALATIGSSIGTYNIEQDVFNYLENAQVNIPVLIMHGKNDSSIPFDGGRVDPDLDFAGAYDVVSYWLTNNQCNRNPTQLENKGFYNKETYSDCEKGAPVEFYALNNTGHIWPGGLLDLSKFYNKNSIIATDVIWEFLNTYSK